MLLIPAVLALAPSAATDRRAWDGSEFVGTWCLDRITDGRRTRDDLDETLRIEVDGNRIRFDYSIDDRFGERRLELEAPLDDTPTAQQVQGREAVFRATLTDDLLIWELERNAPFGEIRNRREMRIAAGGNALESTRYNLEKNGEVDSQWSETWLRVSAEGSRKPGESNCAARA